MKNLFNSHNLRLKNFFKLSFIYVFFFSILISPFIQPVEAAVNFEHRDPTFNSGNGGGISANGTIYSFAEQSDGKILVGGDYSFSSFNGNLLSGGTQNGSITRLNSDGSFDSTFNTGGTGFNGNFSTIKKIIVLSSGKILVAGGFTSYNGVTVSASLVRLNSDGTLDTTFNSGGAGFAGNLGNNTVANDMVLQSDGKIVVVGNFTTYNGVSKSCIVRLNADGSIDSSFSVGTGVGGQWLNVVALQPSDGKILIGGWLTSYNGTSRSYIARINTNGTIDTTFTATLNRGVFSIAVDSNGKAVIGGQFTTASGQSRNGIARLLTTGAYDSTFNPGTGVEYTATSSYTVVNTISILSSGKIFIGGGYFAKYNGTTRNIYAKINSDGSLDTTFDPGTGFQSTDSANTVFPLSTGKILVGGSFTTYQGNSSQGLVRINSDASYDTTFNPKNGLNGSVYASATQSDGKIIIAGSFTKFGSITANRIVRLNTDGTLDASFNSGGTGANSTIRYLHVLDNDKIIIVGGFSSYNGVVKGNVIQLNSDGTLDTSFNTLNKTTTSSYGFYIRSQSDGKIIITGNFTSFGGVARGYILRLNSDGSLDESFLSSGAGANAIIMAAELQLDGKIIIVGNFTTYNGVTRNRIARLNSDGSLDTNFLNTGTGAEAVINTVGIQEDGKILIGGSFTTYNGTTRNRLARVNTDGSLDTSFLATGTGVTGANLIVNSLKIQPDGKIVIVGRFAAYNGVSRNRIARVNTDGSLDTSFDVGTAISNSSSDLQDVFIQPDGKILIGGQFTTYIKSGANNFIRLNQNQTEYQITPPVALTLDFKDIYLNNSVKVGSSRGLNNSNAYVNIINNNNSYISKINIDMSADRDWTNLVADTNETSKSFISNSAGAISSLPGYKAASTFTLYVPKYDSLGVGFCPDATNLSEVTSSCINLKYIASGASDTVGSDTVTVTAGTGTYSNYWLASGLSTKMGAFDEINDTTPPSTPNAMTTSDEVSGEITGAFTADIPSGSTDTGGSGLASYSLWKCDNELLTINCVVIQSGVLGATVNVSGEFLPAEDSTFYYYWTSIDNAGNTSDKSVAKALTMNAVLPPTYTDTPTPTVTVTPIPGGTTIQNVSSGIVPVLVTDWNTNLETTAQTGTPTVGVEDTINANIKVAEMPVNFGSSPDWSGVTGATAENLAYFHSTQPISTITNGAASSYTLYIRKGEGDKVLICPGAISLSEVTLTCSGGYYLSAGETKNGATATVITNGVEYWKVSGLTSTGGMSVLTGLRDTLSRLQVSEPSDHKITFGSTYGMIVGSTDTMEISMPDFDLSAITLSDIELTDSVGSARTLASSASDSTWGVIINSTAKTITFTVPTSGTGGYDAPSQIAIKIGTNAGGTNQIINPSSVGNKTVSITLNNTAPGEMGNVNIPIVDSDRVDITGYVTAYIHFDIDTATGEVPGVDPVIDCNYNACQTHENGDPGTNYTVDLGELTSAVVNKSNSTSVAHTSGGNGIINSIYFDISTNAPSGAVVTVKSTNGGLQGPGTNKIPSIGISTGADGVTRSDGDDIPANSGVYGYNLPVASSALLGSIIPNSLCDSAVKYCGADTITPKTVFTTNNLPVDTARVRMDLAAAANYTNNPGLYTDTLTFIATATF